MLAIEQFKRHFHEVKKSWDSEKTLVHVFASSERLQHPHVMWIFLLNLLLGSTVVFYITALVWASNPKEVQVPIYSTEGGACVEDVFELQDEKNVKLPHAGKHPNESEIKRVSSDSLEENIIKFDEDILKLRLEKLQNLYSQGVLTDIEYQDQRKLIISEI